MTSKRPLDLDDLNQVADALEPHFTSITKSIVALDKHNQASLLAMGKRIDESNVITRERIDQERQARREEIAQVNKESQDSIRLIHDRRKKDLILLKKWTPPTLVIMCMVYIKESRDFFMSLISKIL